MRKRLPWLLLILLCLLFIPSKAFAALVLNDAISEIKTVAFDLGDDRHGVIPNLPFTETLLGKHRGQEDPGLAIAREFLTHPSRYPLKPRRRF